MTRNTDPSMERKLSGASREAVGTVALFRQRIRLRTVCADGEQIGHIVSVAFDHEVANLIGFHVEVAGQQRFLPLAAINTIGPCGVEVDRSFVEGAGNIVPLGPVLPDVRKLPVACDHRAWGWVDDIVVDLGSGAIVSVELGSGDRIDRGELSFDGDGWHRECGCATQRARHLTALAG